MQKPLPSWNLHLEHVSQGWRCGETNEEAVVIIQARDDQNSGLRPQHWP